VSRCLRSKDGTSKDHDLGLPRKHNREARNVGLLLHKEVILRKAPAHENGFNLVSGLVQLLDDVSRSILRN